MDQIFEKLPEVRADPFAKSFLYRSNEDLLKGLLVEILIAKADVSQPTKTNFIRQLLIGAAQKNLNEAIWWVSRLAYYCECGARDASKLFS